MFDIEIKAKGFEKTLQNLAAYDQIATRENKNAMQKSVNLVSRIAKMEAPVGVVGELRSKIHGEVISTGPGAVIGVVGSYAPHGAVVEEGGDPHWPNIKGIALWVMRKLQVRGKSWASVTFLVARAISRAGTKAQPYLHPAFEKSRNKIQGYFEQALNNIVRKLGA
jgi:hypothetical protein